MDHPLQVPAFLFRSPLQTLVDNDVVEKEVEYSVTKNSQPDADHVRIVFHLCKVIKDRDGWQAENQGEQVIFFQGFVMNSMVRPVPSPEEPMHHILMGKPGDKLPKKEGREHDDQANGDQFGIHGYIVIISCVFSILNLSFRIRRR